MNQKKLVITVPWAHRYLSPNARVIWQLKHRMAKQARQTARLLTFVKVGCGFKAKPVDDVIEVSLIAHPCDRRKRDEDNIIASMKSTLDGIADALGVNDAAFHFKELKFSDTRKPPEVEVWLSWKELPGE